MSKRAPVLKRGKKIGIPLIAAIGAMGLSIVSFQDFKPGLEAAFAKGRLQIVRVPQTQTDDRIDIRDLAPPRPERMPSSLVIPQSGTDLNSVGSDWIQRQASSLLDGADQRLLASINKRMNRFLKFEPVEGEPWPEPNGDSEGSGGGSGDGSGSGDGGLPPGFPNPEDIFGYKPTYLRFTTLNRVEMGLANNDQLGCAINGDSIQLNLSHSIGESMGLDLRHSSKDRASSVHWNYNW